MVELRGPAALGFAVLANVPVLVRSTPDGGREMAMEYGETAAGMTGG
jgi:hypothetical protein